jgi:hypothetical protein
MFFEKKITSSSVFDFIYLLIHNRKITVFSHKVVIFSEKLFPNKFQRETEKTTSLK